MKYTMNVKPGASIKIVTEIDLTRERIHVRSSTVYDVNGAFVIVAQTDPPVLKSMLHKEVVVTYLKHEKGGLVRYGFPATVMEFVDNYRLNETQDVKALVVSQKAEPAPYSVRMFFRVEPTGKSNLTMSIDGKEVNVLDISLGGIKFSHDRHLAIGGPGSVVGARMGIDGKFYDLKARILRTWEGDNERLRGHLKFTSAEFHNMNKTLEHELSRKIHQIQVESRLKEGYR